VIQQEDAVRINTRGIGVGWIRHAAAAALAALVWLAPLSGATEFTKYHTYDELTAALKAVVGAHSDLAKLTSIGKTGQGRSLWAVEIANPAGVPVGERSGLLIAANFEGDHLIGSELALATVEHLLNGYASDPAIKQRLDTFVFYVVPRVNPDGAERMFAPVKTGSRLNLTPFDWDNDGRLDEDPPEDVNKDGLITLMRVKDLKGPYMVDPADSRLMKRADAAKGEQGGYAIYWEGFDKDNDGFIAEDGPGGIDINRNFMHRYAYFQPDAGRYMVSEAETRAMLDYVLAHDNIAAMLTFGESDNLIVAPGRRGDLAAAGTVGLFEFADRSNADARRTGMFQDVSAGFGGRGGRGGGGGRGGEYEAVVAGGRGSAPTTQTPGGRGGPGRTASTAISANDIEYFLTVSEQYRQMTGLRTPPPVRTPAGAFFEYGYYQYGVPSFSTPGWGMQPRAAAGAPASTFSDADAVGVGPSVPQGGQRGSGSGAQGSGRGGAAQTAAGRSGMTQMGGAEATGPAYVDQRVVRWMDTEKIDGFVPWTPFKHPTLGDVEVGGFKPYVLTNPPADRIAELVPGHVKFVLYLPTLFPKVQVAGTDVTAHGGGIYRIKAQVVNTGYLPTALAQGALARSVKPTLVQLGVDTKDIIAGNDKTNFITTLAGSGGLQSYEWIVKGKPGSTVTLKVASQKGGRDSVTLRLQ
jgi:murein tripeptide amidase MpaA